MNKIGFHGLFKGNSTDGFQPLFNNAIGSILYDAGRFRSGRSSFRGIVFEPAVLWRVMGWGNDYSIGKPSSSAPVVCEYGMGNDGSGGISKTLLHHDVYLIGGKHLDRGGKRRLGKGMGIHSHEEGAVDAFASSIFTDGLGNGQDVVLVEALLERRTPVT